MSSNGKPDEDPFAKLPKYDARNFEPPEWSRTGFFAEGGAASSSAAAAGPSTSSPKPTSKPSFFKRNGPGPRAGGSTKPGQRDEGHDGPRRPSAWGDHDDDYNDLAEFDDQSSDDEFVDARETLDDAGVEHDPDEFDPSIVRFTVPELRKLLARALELKAEGNAYFTAKPPAHELAKEAYLKATAALPDVPARPAGGSESKTAPPVASSSSQAKAAPSSGIVEVDDDEAAAIQAELERVSLTDAGEKQETEEERAKRERDEVEDEIRECTKAVYGNLGACHIALNDDKEAVAACAKAIEIDPNYAKARLRRAGANERIGSWTALTSAQDDYTALLNLLPPSSPQLAQARRALRTLPSRITAQQEKEKDEMMGKLKELGDSLLGRFGLNTDMFKFDQQPGGGYSMRFGQ